MPNARIELRSYSCPGSRPALRHAIRKAGLAPMKVGRVSSATRHCQPTSGHVGSPSSITIDDRTSSAATSAFHIIQEVVLNQSRRPPGFRSQLNACALRFSSRMPPWPWTIAFGLPVVPDEKSTNSGWSKATGSKASGPGSARSSSQGRASTISCSPYGHVHDVAERRQGGADRRHLFAAVDRAVAEAVPADRQQHRRLELHEAVDHAAHAELGRAARPDRSEARRCCERDQRLGDVRQVGDDAVARADAEPHEPGPCTRHLLAEVGKRELGRLARLRVRDDRDLVRVLLVAEQVLCEVQPRTREPGRAGHRVGGEDGAVRGVGLDLEELPDRRPETGKVVD